jgi:hypothetical protein
MAAANYIPIQSTRRHVLKQQRYSPNALAPLRLTPTSERRTCNPARDRRGNERKGLDLEIAYRRLVRDDRAFSVYVF